MSVILNIKIKFPISSKKAQSLLKYNLVLLRKQNGILPST